VEHAAKRKPKGEAKGELFERDAAPRPQRSELMHGRAALRTVGFDGEKKSVSPAPRRHGVAQDAPFLELRRELCDADSPLEAVWMVLMRLKPFTLEQAMADLGLPAPAQHVLADHEELVKRVARSLQ
jgi:hypothetical protein